MNAFLRRPLVTLFFIKVQLCLFYFLLKNDASVPLLFFKGIYVLKRIDFLIVKAIVERRFYLGFAYFFDANILIEKRSIVKIEFDFRLSLYYYIIYLSFDHY